MKPIIGIVPLVDKQKDSYWMLPGYMNGIKKAGGIPVMLPLTEDTEDINSLMQKLDGVIFSGGQDIDPKLYQELNLSCSELCEKRDSMEVKLFKKVIEENKPAYGICRGLQLFNACLGGSLYQDIPTQLPSDVKHVQKPPYDKAIHSVEIYKDTLLYDIVEEERLEVNSYHHQGIKDVAPSLEVMAVAPDGLVEAVYMPTKRFIMATQWHPEFSYKKDENSLKIFKAFVNKCEEYQKGRGNDNE